MGRGGKRIGSGRKKKDVKLVLLEGNPGKRSLPDVDDSAAGDKIAFENIAMRCPAWLDKEARGTWRRIKSVLSEAGIIKKTDSDAMAMMCWLHERWSAAANIIATRGILMKDLNGALVENPYLKIEDKLWGKLKSMYSEFGMTPSSRMRVQSERVKPDNDEFENFLNKKIK